MAVLAALNPPGARWDGFVLMGGFSLCLVIPGWLIALPAILWIKPDRSRNVITLAVIGILVGPGIMLALDLWTLRRNPTFIPRGPGLFEYLAAAISFLATAIYLGLLKAMSRNPPIRPYEISRQRL